MKVSKRSMHDAKKIMKRMVEITPYDTTVLNNYSLAILTEAVSMLNKQEEIDRNKLELAKEYIYQASDLDLHLHGVEHLLPAYKNICLLRIIEAHIHHRDKERFSAFVFAWMSRR